MSDNILRILLQTRLSNNAEKDLNKQIEELSKKLNGIVIKVNAGDAANKINTVRQSTDALSESTNRAGQSFSSAFTKMMQWSLVGTAIFGTKRILEDTISTIIELDTQMVQLKRVMDKETNFDSMLQGSIEIANELGQKVTDINKALITAAQAGFKANDALDITRTATIASNVSDMTPDESMSNMIAAMKAFNIEAENSISIIDKLNEVDNNYAVSTKNLAQSVTHAGAAAQTYGVTLDQLIGYTTAIGEVTRESGNVIGNMEKSVFSRLYTSDSIRVLDTVNIKTKDLNGENRKASDILSDLGTNWTKFSSTQQQNIGVTVAGRNQLTRFLALLNNWDTAVSATKTSINSQGSAMRENQKYMESLQAKLNLLTTAWEQLAEVIGENGLKGMFSGFVTTLTTLVKGFTEATQATDGWNIKIPVLAAGLYGLVRAFQAVRVAAEGAKLSMGWLGLGLIAIDLIASAFIGASNATKVNTQALTENSNTVQDNVTSLLALNEEYKKSSNTLEQLHTIREKMSNLMPEIIDHYDNEGKAVYRTSEQIDILINKEKELSLQRQKNLANTLSDTLKPVVSDISSSRSNISSVNDDSNYLKARLEALTYAEEYINKTDLANVDKFSKEYTDKITNLQENIRNIFTKNHSFNNDSFLSSELLQFNGNLGLAVEDARKNLGNMQLTIDSETDKINENLKKFADGFKIINNVVLSETGNADKTVKGFFDKIADSFAESSNIDGDNYQVVIANYRKLSDNIGKAISDKKIDISKIIQTGDFEALKKIFLDSGVSLGTFNEAVKNFGQIADKTASSTINYTESLNQLEDSISNTDKSISSLASAYQKLNEGEELSTSEILKLAKEHPQLLSYLNTHNGLIQDKGQILQEVAEIERKTQLAEAENLRNSVVNTYNALESKRKMYEEFYSKMAPTLNPFLGMDSFTSKFGGKGGLSDVEKQQLADVKKQKDELDLTVQLLSKPISLSTYGKKPDKPKAEVAAFDESDKFNITDPYERQLTAIDAKLKESQAIQNNYTESQQEFRDELSKQIDLYKEKQILVGEEADALRGSNVEIEKRLSSEKLNQKQQNDLNKQLNDNKNKISDLSAAWFDYQKASTDANSKITDSLKKEVDGRFNFSKSWIDEQKALSKLSLEEELAAWKRVVNNHLDDEKQLAQVREENAKKRIDAEKEVHRVQKELASDSISKIKETLKTGIDSYIEELKKKVSSKELYDLSELDSSINEIYNSLDNIDKRFPNGFSFVDTSDTARSKLQSYKSGILDIVKQVQDYANFSTNDPFSMDKNLQSEANYINFLKDKLSDLKRVIHETQNAFTQQENAMADNIKQQEKAYDSQIQAQKDKLKLLDDEIAKEDRLKSIKDINDQIDKVKNDKRFSYINENGVEELTYDKGKVDELTKQRDDLLKQYQREDIKQAIQNNIDTLEKSKNDTIAQLQDQLDKTKQVHQQELESLRLYQSNTQQLYGLLNEDFQNKTEQYSTMLKDFAADIGTKLDDATKTAGTGTANFQSVIDTWQNSSISNLTTYVSNVGSQLALLQSYYSQMGAVNSSYGNYSGVSSYTPTKQTGTLVPKYHTGGTVGQSPLQEGEVPAILKVGEDVFTKIQKLKLEDIIVKPLDYLSGLFGNTKNSLPNITPNTAASSVNEQHYHFNNLTVKSDSVDNFLDQINFLVTSTRK